MSKLKLEQLQEFLELGEKIQALNYKGEEQADYWFIANRIGPQMVRELMEARELLEAVLAEMESEGDVIDLEDWVKVAKQFLGE